MLHQANKVCNLDGGLRQTQLGQLETHMVLALRCRVRGNVAVFAEKVGAFGTVQHGRQLVAKRAQTSKLVRRAPRVQRKLNLLLVLVLALGRHH